MRKKNGLGSERERALSDKNEKEKWVGFQRKRERERTRAQVVEEIIKKLRISIILIKEVLDELMWVFCKSEGIKQKKQVFSVKMDV